MKVVLFGSHGMLGYDLVEVFRDYDLYAFSKSEVDISSKKQVFNVLSKINPDIVINAAAYTSVDGSEINKKAALLVNATAVKYISLACNRYGSTLVHFSTDYVFSGKNPNGYVESSRRSPINFYGISKMEGEDYVRSLCKKYYIVRTQWLYGKYGINFVDTIIRWGKEKNEIRVVNDQFGSPTYTVDVANKIKTLLKTCRFGVYHITNKGVCTWHDFAKFIVKLINLNVKIIPITSEELKKSAKRPKYSVLINTKFKAKIRGWKSALKEYIYPG